MYNIGTVLARYMPQNLYHNCSCQKKWYIYICFQIFFVGANCTAHPERLIQTTHLQRRIFIYCLSSNYCMPFPSQHPPLKGLCVCLSNLFALCVGTSLWHVVISPARACRQNLSPLTCQAELIKKMGRSLRRSCTMSMKLLEVSWAVLMHLEHSLL